MRLRHPQRLIEIDVPIRKISAHARREKLGARLFLALVPDKEA